MATNKKKERDHMTKKEKQIELFGELKELLDDFMKRAAMTPGGWLDTKSHYLNMEVSSGIMSRLIPLCIEDGSVRMVKRYMAGELGQHKDQ